MVRGAVLYEYAGEFSLATVRACGVLSQIGGASPHFTNRYLPWLPAVYRYSVTGIVSVTDLAIDCDYLVVALIDR